MKEQSNHLTKVKYSSVLCDVPCSGDGTLRKSKVMWADWHPGRSLGLHRLQLNILKRSVPSRLHPVDNGEKGPSNWYQWVSISLTGDWSCLRLTVPWYTRRSKFLLNIMNMNVHFHM